MNVCVLGGVVADEGVNNSLWLLGRSSVVEINERLAVHRLLKDGEVGPHFRDVQTGLSNRVRPADGFSRSHSSASVLASRLYTSRPPTIGVRPHQHARRPG